MPPRLERIDMKLMFAGSILSLLLTSPALAQGCPSPARVYSITVTGSGGLGSAEMVVNLEPGGSVRVDNFAAPQVFVSMATLLNQAMARQQLVHVSCVPQPPGYLPVLSQVVVYRPRSINAKRARHAHR
jgi:hypothetical protein